MSPLETTPLEVLLTQRAWLVRVVEALVRDPAEADEVASEAMRRARRTLAGPAGSALAAPERLRAWLRSTARFVTLERRRATLRRREAESIASRPERDDRAADAMARAELREELSAAVMTLPSPQREVLVLRYFEEMEYADIADAVGLSSPAAARQHSSRGLRALRERLDQKGGRERWFAAAIGLLDAEGAVAAGAASAAPALLGALVLACGAGLAALLVSSRDAANPDPDGELQLGVVELLEEEGDLIDVEAASEPRVAAATSEREPLGAGFRAAPWRPGVGLRARLVLGYTKSGEPIPPTRPVPFELTEAGAFDPEGMPGVVDGPSFTTPLYSGTSDDAGRIHVPWAIVASAYHGPDAQLAPLFSIVVDREADHAAGTWPVRTAMGPDAGDLVLPRGTTVRGRVLEHDGSPARGAAIWLSHGYKDFVHAGTADREGRFELKHLAAVGRGFRFSEGGEVRPDRLAEPRIAASRDMDRSAGEVTVSIARQDEAVVWVNDLVLPRLGALEGRVIDVNGEPVRGALVTRFDLRSGFTQLPGGGRGRVLLPWEPDGFAPPGAALTDGRGRFSIPWDPSRSHSRVHLFAYSKGGLVAARTLDPAISATIGIKLVLDPRRSVRLRLIDAATGKPVETTRAQGSDNAFVRFAQSSSYASDGTRIERAGLVRLVRPPEVSPGSAMTVEVDGYRKQRVLVGPLGRVQRVELEPAGVLEVSLSMPDASGERPPESLTVFTATKDTKGRLQTSPPRVVAATARLGESTRISTRGEERVMVVVLPRLSEGLQSPLPQIFGPFDRAAGSVSIELEVPERLPRGGRRGGEGSPWNPVPKRKR